jgi:uncharacterized membrane protein YhaH (DUF805 family)
MTFGNAIKAGFTNALKFRGVASRSEFWWFALFSFIVGSASSIIDTAFGLDQYLGGLVGVIASIALLLPRFTLLIRRFRDAGVSPLWLITALVPLSGLVSWVLNNYERLSAFVQVAPTLSDEQLAVMVEQLIADPAFVDSLVQLLAILFLAFLYTVFELVITVLPSKRQAQPVVASTDY